MSEAVDPRNDFVAVPPGQRDTVIVAAGDGGWTEYQSSGAYICWPGQPFWEKVTHFGFYADGEIKPVIARVRTWHDEVLLTATEAASRRAEGDTELAAAIDFFLAQGTRDDGDYYGIILLSHPEDPDTVRLAAPIVSDKTSWSGRRTAWTQRFSYSGLASLTKGFTLTSSLDDDFKRPLGRAGGGSHGRGDVAGRGKEGDSQTVPLRETAAESGEVILQVWRTGSGYNFQLIGEQLREPETISQLVAEPLEVARTLISELRAMSEGKSRRAQYAAPSLARERLENLGTMLWADVVPVSIREQFWEQRDKITSFTITSNSNMTDTMPWELLYPNDRGHNRAGFLVEQFPVVRRPYGQARVRTLELDGGIGFIGPSPKACPTGEPRPAARPSVTCSRPTRCRACSTSRATPSSIAGPKPSITGPKRKFSWTAAD